MTNDEMKPGRYFRWHNFRRLVDNVKAHLASDGRDWTADISATSARRARALCCARASGEVDCKYAKFLYGRYVTKTA